MKKIFATAILGLVMAVMPVAANPINKVNGDVEGPEKMVKKIRKELVTLPFYGVFDNLAFKYEDGKVVLYGQVSRPTLKSDAKRVVERVAGVEQVENKIEVLPLSNLMIRFGWRPIARFTASRGWIGCRYRPCRRFTSSSRTAM